MFTDDVGGACIATSHLLEQGFRRIVFVGGDKEKYSARARAQGYCQAMAEHSLRPEIIDAGFSGRFGIQAADEIMAMESLPDAVVCASDARPTG